MPGRRRGFVRRRQDDGARTIAEQDACAAVGVVEEPGQQLCADDQDVTGHAGREVGAGGGVRVHEAGACSHHVERRRPGVADGLLDQGRRRGHPVVGRERGQQDHVDVVRIETGGPDRAQPGDRTHRRRRLVGGGDPPLANTGPADDPLVGGVDHPLQVRVGQDLGGSVAAPAGEPDGAGRGDGHAGSTSISACFVLTSTPLSTHTRTTRPARSLLISLNSFMASISPMVWPTAT